MHPRANSSHRSAQSGRHTSRMESSTVCDGSITPEYIYVNTPEQSRHSESFYKTLKECVWPRKFVDIREAREAMRAALRGYNHTRIHSALEA